MAEIMFEEYKSIILSLPKKKRLSRILSDIGCDLPIFYGVVAPKNSMETEKWYVTDIHQINKSNDLSYPYADAPRSSVRIFLANKEGLNIHDRVFFSVSDGRFQYSSELFEIQRIVTISSVLGKSSYKAEDFDYETLITIAAAFSPTGIDAIDQIERRVDGYRQTLSDLEDSMEQASPQIDRINETLEKIKDPGDLERLASYSSKVTDTLDRLTRDHLPSTEYLDDLNLKWAELQKQAAVTLETIDKVTRRLSDVQHEFIDAYPETKHLIVPGDKREVAYSELDTVKKRLKYAYPEEKIKLFMTALNTVQIIALCGKPGTGKTTFAEQMSRALGACFHLVEVQNNWTDRSDLLGYYNPANKTYQSTDFLEALLEAKADLKTNGENAHLHIICLDEMNLSRIEYYFATFLSLLQRSEDERWISLLPSDADCSIKEGKSEEQLAELSKLGRYSRFLLPENVRFVGTLNMDDTAQFLSPKVIDRSIFIEFDLETVYEENSSDDLNDDLYFPYTAFCKEQSSVDEVESVTALLKALYPIAPRLLTYLRKMWPAFKSLSADDPSVSFADAVMMSKILPSVVRKLKDVQGNAIEIPDILKRSRNRYQEGIERGNLLHHYDAEIWSYWE